MDVDVLSELPADLLAELGVRRARFNTVEKKRQEEEEEERKRAEEKRARRRRDRLCDGEDEPLRKKPKLPEGPLRKVFFEPAWKEYLSGGLFMPHRLKKGRAYSQQLQEFIQETAESDLEGLSVSQACKDAVVKAASRGVPLPCGDAVSLWAETSNFQLPFDFWELEEELRNETTSRRSNTKGPSPYQKISSNIYLEKERRLCMDEMPVCHCDPFTGNCGEDCLNRIMCVECHPKLCPCEERCTNNRISKKKWAKLKVLETEKKGWGLFADQDLEEDDLIVNYVGEVIPTGMWKARLAEYDGERHCYFLNLDSQYVIDASRRGNVGRFINHSCDPNTRTEKWTVNGREQLVVVANRKIVKGEEICFDYKFESSSEHRQKCLCGAPNCKKFIGARADADRRKKVSSGNGSASSSQSSVASSSQQEQSKRASSAQNLEKTKASAERKFRNACIQSKSVIINYMMRFSIPEVRVSTLLGPCPYTATADYFDPTQQAGVLRSPIFLRRNANRVLSVRRAFCEEVLEEAQQWADAQAAELELIPEKMDARTRKRMERQERQFMQQFGKQQGTVNKTGKAHMNGNSQGN